MTNDVLFRVVLAFEACALVVIWLRAALASGIQKDLIYNPREGWLLALGVRSLVLASGVGLFLYLVDPSLMAWACYPLPTLLRWCGSLVGVLGLFILLSAQTALGRHFSTSLRLRKNHELVRTGPYRWVRHPLYDGYLCLWVSFLLLSSNLWIGGLGIIAFGLVMGIRTPREEKMMQERFGQTYQAYIQETGRFLPCCRPECFGRHETEMSGKKKG